MIQRIASAFLPGTEPPTPLSNGRRFLLFISRNNDYFSETYMETKKSAGKASFVFRTARILGNFVMGLAKIMP
jgi:hypothetical protein